jgi:hypothetical protein
MLDEANKPVPLPREKILYTSPARTTLEIKTSNTYPGKAPLALSSAAGIAYLTNQRVFPPQAGEERFIADELE